MSCTPDLPGDIWTLSLVRDLLPGKGTYSDFQHLPGGIPTNILAECLKRLQAVKSAGPDS